MTRFGTILPAAAGVALCATLVVAPAVGQEPLEVQEPQKSTAKTVTPLFPVPRGWKAETVEPLPESLAEMNLEGYIGVRYPPGFGEGGNARHLSHAMVLRIAHHPAPDTDFMEAVLPVIYTWFLRHVAESGRIGGHSGEGESATGEIPPVRLVKTTRSDGLVGYLGHALRRWNFVLEGVDPVEGGDPLELHINVDTWFCEKQGEGILFFRGGAGRSDKKREDLLWQAMKTFHCHGPSPRPPEREMEFDPDRGPKGKTKLRFG
jgi:hypothetical protein